MKSGAIFLPERGLFIGHAIIFNLNHYSDGIYPRLKTPFNF